jgi:hypothetical protein
MGQMPIPDRQREKKKEKKTTDWGRGDHDWLRTIMSFVFLFCFALFLAVLGLNSAPHTC